MTDKKRIYQDRAAGDARHSAPPTLVIAGTSSGVGKTTVAVGIMGALRRRGLHVAPFKIGPDYIDPGFHLAATGIPSRNLDTWLTGRDTARDIFVRGAAGADFAVIEGVMGLFDGRAGACGEGSTAEMATLVDGDVVLVVDCSSMARSLAPLLAGFAAFDQRVRLVGTVLNNVGSDGHARALMEAAAEVSVPVLGVLPRDHDISLSSRHLGLVPAQETDDLATGLERVIDHVDANLDMDALLSICGVASQGAMSRETAGKSEARSAEVTDAGQQQLGEMDDRVRIAVARDAAFSFYYLDSLEALEAAGAILTFFSPMHDSRLPDCDGIYLGGGFPEVFASELEANVAMRESLASAAFSGMPIYAECGGLIYLCRSLEVEGSSLRMAGVIPAEARMNASRQALGYVEAFAKEDNLLMRKGDCIHGHEFHWSTVEWAENSPAYECVSARRRGREPEGFARDNLLASFVHVNFAGYPGAARNFISCCARARGVVRDGAC